MPQSHLLLIPMVFLIGVLFGRQISNRQDEPKTNTIPLFISFSLLLLVYITTHGFPYFGGVKAISLATGGLKILDSSPAFTELEVYHRLEAFGETGREMYGRLTYTSDLVFPLSFLIFLILLVRHILKSNFNVSNLTTTLLYVLPILWFLSDLAENSIVYRLIDNYPHHLEISGILGYVTVVKFVLMGLSLVAPLALWIYFSIRKVKSF